MYTPDFALTRKNLERHGFKTSFFETAAEAADYLDCKIDGKTVGIGGSQSVEQLGLTERLETHNTISARNRKDPTDEAAITEVYISSVNGLAETGEIINIDGNGNRVASTIFGHKTLYLIVGVNKLAADYDAALWRARNIASPLNARRLKRNTPCAAKGDRCYNCNSPERICRALVVLWDKPFAIEEAEVVLVNEELGF